jgi:hypothetical protein
VSRAAEDQFAEIVGYCTRQANFCNRWRRRQQSQGRDAGEMQITRATTPRAHREITRQMRLGPRRKRRDFLMPDMYTLDFALPLAPTCLARRT